MMNKSCLVLSVSVLSGVAFGKSVVYENDFTSRRSTNGVVPTADWYVMPYSCTYLANNIKGDFDVTEPWSGDNLKKMQDNWRKATTEKDVAFSAKVQDDGGNQQLVFATSKSGRQDATAIVNTFHNAFTNGTLRLRYDVKIPTQWTTVEDASTYLRLQPLTRKALQRTDSLSETTIFNFGIQRVDATRTRPYFLYYKSNRSTAQSVASDDVELVPGDWYRLTTDLDVAAGQIRLAQLDHLGSSHPAIDSVPVASGLINYTGAMYTKAVTAPDNPIEGLAFRINEYTSHTDLVCDNVVCSWKAPDSETYEVFYENDFSTRRYRTLAPVGTTTAAYVRDEETTSVYSADYSAITLANETDTTPANAAMLQDERSAGFAGWRRCLSGPAEMTPVKFGGYAMLRASSTAKDKYVIGSQDLGETIESGVVRLAFDLRAPDKWYYDKYRMLYAALGVPSAHGSSSSLATLYAGRLGLGEKNKDDGSATVFRAYSQFGKEDYSDTTFESNRWYRGILTVDLTNRKTKGVLYSLGTDQPSISDVPSGEPVYVKEQDSVCNDVTQIRTLVLGAYGPKTGNGAAYFDNIQVWKNWNEDTQTGDLLYRDTFVAQTRGIAAQQRGKTVGTFQIDDGQDGWVRRHNGEGEMWVTSGENPALAVSAARDFVYGVQPLGMRIRDGKIRAQLDMRPPVFWTDSDAYALVSLGDDMYLQGSASTVTNAIRFICQTAPTFGFGRNPANPLTNGISRAISVRYAVGDGNGGKTDAYSPNLLDRTHWYRFKMKGDLRANTYSLAVYDLGTSHPTAETVEGARCFEVGDVPFRKNPVGGITSWGVTVSGNQPLHPEEADDSGLVLIDNVKVWNNPNGLMLLVR